MNKILTVSEAASYLGVKIKTILSWIKDKKMPCLYYHLSGKNDYRFKREDIEELMRKNGVKS